MFWLGLLLPNFYIAGVTGFEVFPQWALLALILPVLVYDHIVLPKAFLLWFAFGLFSLTLSLHWITWLWGMIQLSVWGLTFQLGRVTINPAPLIRGFAWGLTISSVICIAQWLGWIILPQSGAYAALVFNNGILSICCGLIIVALAMYQQAELIPFLLPALYLSHSRAGYFVIVIAIATRIHWLLPFALLAVCGFLTNTYSDPERLQVWGVTLQCLSWWGHGSGSFIDLFYQTHDRSIVHPEWVHNDYLQLWYEYGAFAIIPYLCICAGLSWRVSPLVYSAAFCAAIDPLLYQPLTAFILCFALGHNLRDLSLSRLSLLVRRSGLLPWFQTNPAMDHATLPLHVEAPQHKEIAS